MRIKEKGLQAGYTVEAAGVMAVVFFTLMVLIGQAFRIHAEVSGSFALHKEVEQKRHAIAQIDEQEITLETSGRDWNLEICAPVFRPEEKLRAWSLVEEQE
ncbi:MAG: hypothetical protein ACI39W_05925 [Brotaphodocola sp.]